MPWRVPPDEKKKGIKPDPYKVWLSEIMLQQTTVAAVKSYFERFVTLWPTVTALASEDDSNVMGEWAGLGYYARARNLLKCARVIVAEHDGKFPADHAALLELPGVGPYTAAAISSIAFDLPHAVLDGNVERVMARLYDIHIPLPGAKPELMEKAVALTPENRPGDYAQAVMDLGATLCTPKSPACGICPWRSPCLARQRSTASELPKKTPKKAKPIRYGSVFIGRRADNAWLLETRPNTGLLGGMLGWPGSEWTEKTDTSSDARAPCTANWSKVDTDVRHTFTHFHLVLTVFFSDLPMNAAPERGTFMTQEQFRPSNLPTVMRKAFNAVR